jgi:hypothetical protein
MSKRSEIGLIGPIMVVFILAACGSRAEIVEVTRAVSAAESTMTLKEVVVEKETVVETMMEVTAMPLPTATPFSASFVIEHDVGDTGRRDKATASEAPETKRAKAQTLAPLTAGEIDDNALFRKYLDYLAQYTGPAVFAVDVSERHIISVRDSTGLPVLDAHVTAFSGGRLVFEGRSTATGQVLLHPRAYGLIPGSSVAVRVEKDGVVNELSLVCGQSDHHLVTLNHPGRSGAPVALDVLFLIDATGSMEDEINKLKATILEISAQIGTLPASPAVRFGMVTYRDRGDSDFIKVHDFTSDVRVFQAELSKVRAHGGGDYPESLNEALHRAVWDVRWREGETVRLIFLVADAPPHLDYDQDFAYDEEMLEVVQRGIKIIPIASSGLDEQGEYIYRQLAQFTLGRFVFLTYSEAGQPSSGPGEETDHHIHPQDYTVDILDRLIIRLVSDELTALRDVIVRYWDQ